MTELERKALLGDPEAQRECTENGIALPCPCCGKPVQWDFETKLVLHDYKDFILGKKITPLPHWNSRPALPIGRCGECKAYIDNKCANTGCYKNESGFCDDFVPKRGE